MSAIRRNQPITKFRPYKSKYDISSTTAATRKACVAVAQKFTASLLTKDFAKRFCGEIFYYRLHEGLVATLRQFFRALLFEPFHLICSPQFGTALSKPLLGFQTTLRCEEFLRSPELYFEDYISETTTFVTFHMKYKFDAMFDSAFRVALCRRCIEVLLNIAAEENQLQNMCDVISHVLVLQRIQ